MAASNLVETWDDDEDFDFTSVSQPHLELTRSDSNPQSSDAQSDQGNDEPRAIIQAARKSPHSDNDADYGSDEEDEEEEGDTLKVSDLTKETLAQLASYAKKAKVNQQSQQTMAVEHLGPVEHELDGDWDEDLEVPESLSMDSLKLRAGSSASDVDFETPSLGSTSDATSTSYPDDPVRRGLAFTASPNRQRIHSVLSSASSSASSSVISPARKRGSHSIRMKASSDAMGDPDLSRPMRLLRISNPALLQQTHAPSEQLRLLSSEDEASSSRPPRAGSPSGGSVSKSDTDGQEGEKPDVYDSDLNFDDIYEDTRNRDESLSSVSQQLQARLMRRLGGASNEASGIDDEQAHIAKETDFSTGLIITDDMDLSPSRLRARNLNNRLREAARHRRRKHDHKRSESGRQSLHDAPLRNVTQDGTDLSPAPLTPSSASRLLASTAASRAREAEIRSSTPIQGMRSHSPSHLSSPQFRSFRSLSPINRATSPSLSRTSAKEYTAQEPLQSPRHLQPTKASVSRQMLTQSRKAQPHGHLGKLMHEKLGAREYGDGHELDEIEDLPENKAARSGTAAPAPQRRLVTERGKKKDTQDVSAIQSSTVSNSNKKGRARKKRQPQLIRNLNANVANSSKMVGDMRWNPALKRWEGNEKEGREFENAVRGTGRPALITQLALGSSGVALGGVIASPRLPSSAAALRQEQEQISNTSFTSSVGSPRIVGDMVFDPIQLRWVRQDGKEDLDPFDSLLDSGSDELEGFEGESDDREVDLEHDEDDAQHRRGARQRTVSAGPLPNLSPSSLQGKDRRDVSTLDGKANESVPNISHSDSHRLVSGALKGTRPTSEPPALLRALIPTDLWKSSIEAHRRHERELDGFTPRQTSTARGGRGPAAATAAAASVHRPHSRVDVSAPSSFRGGRVEHPSGRHASDRHLYLIQTLARRDGGAA